MRRFTLPAITPQTFALSALALLSLGGTSRAQSGLITVGPGGDYDVSGGQTWDQVLQQAVNALPVRGGELLLLDGTFEFQTAVNVNKPAVTIRGSKGSILKAGSDAAGTALFNATAPGFRLAEVKIEASPSTLGARSMIRVTKDTFSIEGCQVDILSNGSEILRVVETTGPRLGTLVHGNVFRFPVSSTSAPNVIALFMHDGLSARIIGNSFRSMSDDQPGVVLHAVHFDDEWKGTISGNTFDNLGDAAAGEVLVKLEAPEEEGHHVTVTGNTFTDCAVDYAIVHDDLKYTDISGNLFSGLPGGVRVTSGDSFLLAGNQFSDVGDTDAYAVHLGGDDPCPGIGGSTYAMQVVGNQFGRCTKTQIFAARTVYASKIAANQFHHDPDLPADLLTAIEVDDSCVLGGHFIHDNSAIGAGPGRNWTHVWRVWSDAAQTTSRSCTYDGCQAPCDPLCNARDNYNMQL